MDGQPSIRGGSGYSYGAGSRAMVLIDDLPILTADVAEVKWNFLPVENIDLKNVKQVVIIGIGGSSLGLKAIDSILRPYTPGAKEMLFLENSDPITISETLTKIRKEEACFFMISKNQKDTKTKTKES